MAVRSFLRRLGHAADMHRGRGRHNVAFRRVLKISMREPEMMMPVTCPECGTESLFCLAVAVASHALLAGEPILLRSGCHSHEWDAGPLEREQLREYLGLTPIRGGITPTAKPPEITIPPSSPPAYSVLRHI
jgi:hypothetical protein